jgi:CBS domain containing-hemolysin-like protein
MLWTALAALGGVLAAARTVVRTRDGARGLGGLLGELHQHPRRLLIGLTLAQEVTLVVTTLGVVMLGVRVGGLRGGALAVVPAVLVLLFLRGFATGLADRSVRRGTPIVGAAGAWMLAPLSGVAGVVKWVGQRLVHVFLGEPPGGENVFAPEEFAALTADGDAELAQAERTLVAKAVQFGDRTVRHVLTPRRDIVAVPADVDEEELVRVIRTSGCSRIPVYRDERDEVIGILYARDVIGRRVGPEGIEPLLRQPYVTPPDRSVSDLFRELRARKVHIALVVDEYGSLIGLVTMEDLLEELFGEIRDEFDDDEEHVIRRRGPRTFLVSGRVPVGTLNARLNLEIPPSEDEATIAGVVMDRLGRVPQPGEQLRMEGFTVTVEKLDGPAIALLRVDLWSPSAS